MQKWLAGLWKHYNNVAKLCFIWHFDEKGGDSVKVREQTVVLNWIEGLETFFEGGGGEGGGQAVVSRSVRSLGKVSGPGFTAPRGERREGKKWGRGRKVFHTKYWISNTEEGKYFVGNVGLMHIFLCWNIQLFILLSFGGCRCSRSHPPRHYHKQYKGCVTVPKRMNFRKISKGGGGHFLSEKLCCKLWTFTQGFLSIKS